MNRKESTPNNHYRKKGGRLFYCYSLIILLNSLIYSSTGICSSKQKTKGSKKTAFLKKFLKTGPVTLEYFFNPVTLPCGHNIEEDTYKLLNPKVCPLCRRNYGGEKHSINLYLARIMKSVIEETIDSLDEDVYLPEVIHEIFKNPETMNYWLKICLKQESVSNEKLSDALYYLIFYAELEDIISIIEKGAQLDSVFERGDSFVHLAVQANRLDVLEHLQKKGLTLFGTNNEGMTALHVAAEYNHREVAKYLLKERLEIEALSAEEETPLHIASEVGAYDTISLFYDYYAEFNAKNSMGQTPLHVACEFKNYETVKLLLECQSDINAQDHKGKTALHYAIEQKDLEILKLLLYWKANPNLNTRESQLSSLYYCIQHDFIEGINDLIEGGAQVHDKKSPFGTSLHFALSQKKVAFLPVLIEKKLDLIHHEFQGSQAIHHASFFGNLDAVRILIRNGVNLNAQDANGDTPLIIAFKEKKFGIIKFLLRNGADPKIKNKLQENLNNLARKSKNQDVRQALSKCKKKSCVIS